MPGFERSIIGMNPGDTKTARVTADNVYGPYNEELVKVISRSEFPKNLQPEVGLQIRIQRNDGGTSFVTVTDFTDTNITLDGNHPLAGKDFIFEIELIDIVKTGPSANAYHTMGVFLQEKQEYDEAIKNYQKAIDVQPDFVEAYFNLGVIFHIKGRLDEAIEYYQKALQLNSEHLQANNNLGNALRQKGQLDDAITCFEKSLQLDPGHADTYNNLGAVYQDKENLEKAILYYEKATELNQEFYEAYNNLGNALQKMGLIKKAISFYQKALQLNPNLVDAHINLSSAFLLSGNFLEGWKEHDWRLKKEDFISILHNLPIPFWDGSSLKGKPLLLYAEQGIGDEIMFASCLSDVIAQSYSCIVECDNRLIPLFSRSFPDAKFFEKISTSNVYPPELSKAHFKISIGNLPKFFRQDLYSFPNRKSYLIPDPQYIDLWRRRFNKIRYGLKIGISWRGGQHPYIRSVRSIPLEQWNTLLALSGIHFVNLQYGDCYTELEETRKKLGITIHHWEDADPLKNLDIVAAQIAELDIVISVDNATVHLAGALGVPVWTLLPYVPDWRWMLERDDSPWYPTMRLFRQPSPGDWTSVIKRVQMLLSNLKLPKTGNKIHYK